MSGASRRRRLSAIARADDALDVAAGEVAQQERRVVRGVLEALAEGDQPVDAGGRRGASREDVGEARQERHA